MKKKCLLFISILANIVFIQKIHSQNVDEFTGNFSYTVPVLQVPSPYGPGASIAAGYKAGITVNEGASEIGLGWGISLGGSISRGVSGVPDDWNGAIVADPENAGFNTQGGCMYFKNNTNSENMDFYKSTYKIDTPAFYFPDYDYYSISGPGLNGSLQPHLFDFATTKLNTFRSNNLPVTKYAIDDTYQFSKKMQFNFNGDYAGSFKSRHYSTTPVYGGTTLRYPGYNDTVTDTEYTSGSITPYTGIGGVGYGQSSNRLATAKYVEYFTNQEINDNYATNGFTNILTSSLPRSSTYYEMDGIGSFRITDESGYTYYYTIPVYINSAIYGNYPLNNDYSLPTYASSDTTRHTDGDGNYYIQYNLLSDTYPFMVEWKQNKKYAYNWLLTAVTGPDYTDSDANGIVNSGDKGYWISYDWQLWSRNFIKRTPDFGFNYSFNSNENDFTKDYTIDNNLKVSGKFGSFSKYDQEIYYLNKIQTSSHTAIMVRDIRLDEHAGESNSYDNQSPVTSDIFAKNGNTLTSNYGTLYDDGGVTTDYGNNKNLQVTISPTGASSITIRFNSFDLANDAGDIIYIKDGSNNILATYSYSNPPPETDITFNFSTIKINEVTNSSNVGAGYRIGWIAKHPAVMPQLKLSRIVLFRNEDFDTLNSPSSSSSYYVSSTESAFDLNNTSRSNFYNETWYNHVNNKSDIEAASLQTVEFNQDYSLARKYTSNIKTTVCSTDKNSPPSDVVNGIKTNNTDYSSSGKLTLNEITTYQKGHEKTSPSVLFYYDTATTTKNPDFNPVKIDYSGFYKSDASEEGYSSYTSSASKDYTSAWSLRAIKSPMGGSLSIEYESNEYEKVMNGDGTFRGPSKMYMIKDISLPAGGSGVYGINWGYTLEEDITTPSDFTALKNGPPAGTVNHVFIPFVDETHDQKFINSGTFTFSGAEAQSIEKLFDADHITSDNYIQESGTGSGIDNSVILGSDLKYTGNGYIHFDLPIGTIAYGGGIRVKSITTTNETSGFPDNYVREYSYSGGVATMEYDRFGEEKLGYLYYNPVNLKLRPTDYDRHRMGPAIGYSSVTIKNKGQNDIANGATSYTFITSDSGISNFKPYVQLRTNAADHCNCTGPTCNGTQCYSGACTSLYTDSAYIIEVVDQFGGYWGQVQTIQTTDINNNIISLTKNNYEVSAQGMVVENYDFLTVIRNYLSGDALVGGSGSYGYTASCDQHHHIVCIKRSYPVRLSSQTVYSKGMITNTEYLSFDKVTGVATEISSTTPNNGVSVSRITPAFRISEYSAMGPKSVDSTNANILLPVAATTSVKDSTLSHSSDFMNYAVQTYKNEFTVRQYDSDTTLFINVPLTDRYWVAGKSYNWMGAPGSLDNFGLFKHSELAAAPFDYTLSSIDSKWLFDSENTLMDNSGHVIETKKFNNRFSAKKYGYNERLPIAEAVNVNYASFTGSSFESAENDPAGYIDGEIKLNSATQSTYVTPHTGDYVLKVPSGTTGSGAPVYKSKYYGSDINKGLQKGRTYRASVWVHSSSNNNCRLAASFAGGTAVTVSKTDASNITIGDWIQLNLDLSVNSTPSDGDQLKVYLESPNGDAYFDDLRVHPVDAQITTTVYDPITNRITAKLDANNFATKYIYDAGGRVLEIWQEIEGKGLKRLKKYQYNYARGL